MKKVMIFLSLAVVFHAKGQNIRKGIELFAPPEAGTAGASITGGNFNTLVGYNSGNAITTGNANSFYGYRSGGAPTWTSLTTGSSNSFFGYFSGAVFQGGSSGNTCLGNMAGAGSGVAIAANAYDNTFVGNQCGNASSSAYNLNTMVGARAGYYYTGDKNTFIGASSSAAPTAEYLGTKLTLIGADAKNGSASSLSNATAIGADATVTTSNALVLGNTARVGIGISAPTSTLHIKKLTLFGGYNLYSDSRTNSGSGCNWDNAAFVVSGDNTKAIIVGKSQPLPGCDENSPWTETFFVYGNGDGYARGAFIWSDKRFKKDVLAIKNPIATIKKLEGVSYNLNTDFANETDAKGTPSYGFIAQEVKKVIPEIVSETKNGFYALNYDAIIPFLTEAIKEQQQQIETQQNDIEELKVLIKEQQNNKVLDVEDAVLNNVVKGSYLGQNAPNPFTQNTEIRYILPQAVQQAHIGIYDLNGKEIKLYPLHAKEGTVVIEGNNLQAGLYIYSLLINGEVLQSKKMVLTSN